MHVSETGYGVDVSVRRADDLEKRLLHQVSERPGCRVLDLGCGGGGAAARLTTAGAAVTGVDIHDFSPEWSKLGHFYHADVSQSDWQSQMSTFDYCLCQRMIHYLPYVQAERLLHQLRHLIKKGLYISFSGITSELAVGYETAALPIAERHGCLSKPHQTTFGITQPLTLYDESEAVALLEGTGWNIEWVRTSDFGNVKIVAS